MGTRISPQYETRLMRDEYSLVLKGGPDGIVLGNWPHVHRLLRSDAAQFLMRNLQNLCWTVERLALQVRRKAGSVRRSKRSPVSDAARAPSKPTKSGSRIFLDLTNTYRNGPRGGISRLCLMLAGESRVTGDAVAVVLQNGQLHELLADGLGEKIEISAGDIYLILDLFWSPCQEYLAFSKAAKAKGVVVATAFYDIIPFYYPYVLSAGVLDAFSEALPQMVANADLCISISKASLDDLVAYAASSQKARRETRFAFFTPGSDFVKLSAAPDPDFARRYSAHPLFLSVGTLEPKKGYTITLDAIDALWAAGKSFNFMLIGRYGWNSDAVARRIRTHPRFGTNLFWLENASDAVLEQAYLHCYCFVQASVGEGFGIPVAEAAQHDLPVICSDIDVFKEIGGDDVIYFESENAAFLASRLSEALEHRPTARHISLPTWAESFASLRDTLWAEAAAYRAEVT